MDDYITTILDEAPSDMGGIARTPAANHLFQVNHNNPTKLSHKTAETFHHITAQLLFLCKRSRPDIQTAVAFLSTRVKSPDTDDYKKLARVIQYLRNTKELGLTLEGDDLTAIQWWVDASYATHADMRGHTGAIMTLGKGAAYATSVRQKLVARSSTESELIGVYDVLPQVLWTRNFLIEQGAKVTESIIHQDNQSALILEQNGRGSSSKRTRHLSIRFFFVTEQVAERKVTLKYCPTGDMLADFFTKPLQGEAFLRMRSMIMNIDPHHTVHGDHRSVLAELEEQQKGTCERQSTPSNE